MVDVRTPVDFAALGRETNSLLSAGRWAEAEAICRAILAVDPLHRAARCTLGTLLLARGDPQGWWLYEARRELPESGVRPPPVGYPEWSGQPVRSLLLWGEQGHGDQIMYARFVPLLLARGIEVTIVCRPGLVRLFQAFGVPVVGAQGSFELPPHEAWCLMASLPRHFPSIPTEPYLPGRVGGHGIGVMVSGNPNHPNDANRSLPSAAAADVLSLGRDLSPEATGARDFADTAEIIAGLSLVISVDTAVAHLAGAMGKPTWILLPRLPEWRWSIPWYSSATLYRSDGDGWPAVIAKVRTDVAQI